MGKAAWQVHLPPQARAVVALLFIEATADLKLLLLLFLSEEPFPLRRILYEFEFSAGVGSVIKYDAEVDPFQTRSTIGPDGRGVEASPCLSF